MKEIVPELILSPGETTIVSDDVAIPTDAPPGDMDDLSLKAKSQSVPFLVDVASVNIKVVRYGDFDGDGDVDGLDLFNHIVDGTGVSL